jgi:hypothetical protein
MAPGREKFLQTAGSVRDRIRSGDADRVEALRARLRGQRGLQRGSALRRQKSRLA